MDAAAWLLAQPPAEGDSRHATYLHDRICIRERRPQRYGTQVGPDGQPFVLKEGDVDARPCGVGLSPLAECLRQFQK